jgi:hypothetical protein
MVTLADPNTGGFIPQVTYPGDNCCIFYERNYYDYDHSENWHVQQRKLTLCHNDARTVYRM